MRCRPNGDANVRTCYAGSGNVSSGDSGPSDSSPSDGSPGDGGSRDSDAGS